MREEGRLLVAGFSSGSPEPEAVRIIREFGVAGLILFARNIESPRQVASLVAALQREAVKRLDRPLFIMVDQEGGPVARLREPFTHPPSAKEAAGLPPQDVAETWAKSGREMRAVGINVNLAPVCDLSPPGGYMEERSFGEDPEKAGELVALFVEAMQSRGVMACAKHFPGLGRAHRDPHREGVKVERPREELEGEDLAPFRDAVEKGVCFVMSSHGLYPALDPLFMGTLSPAILTGLLRDEMAFTGLAITDDLEMGAVKEGFGVGEAAVRSVAAGADLALTCSGEEACGLAFEALVKARERRELLREKCNTSISRQKSLLLEYLKDPYPASPEEIAGLLKPAVLA